MPTQGARSNDKNLINERADHALGRSHGGLSTKIHALADTFCCPLTLLFSPGQAGDNPYLVPLLDAHRAHDTEAFRLPADKAYSHPSTRKHLRECRISHTIPERRDQIRRRKRRDRTGVGRRRSIRSGTANATPSSVVSGVSSSGVASPRATTSTPPPISVAYSSLRSSFITASAKSRHAQVAESVRVVAWPAVSSGSNSYPKRRCRVPASTSPAKLSCSTPLRTRFFTVGAPDRADGERWDEVVARNAWCLRRATLSIRDAARLIAWMGSQSPSLDNGIEQIASLEDAGFSGTEAALTSIAISRYTNGSPIEQQTARVTVVSLPSSPTGPTGPQLTSLTSHGESSPLAKTASSTRAWRPPSRTRPNVALDGLSIVRATHPNDPRAKWTLWRTEGAREHLGEIEGSPLRVAARPGPAGRATDAVLHTAQGAKCTAPDRLRLS
ncbi:transposase [Rhodococcus koreensis]